MGRLLIFVNLIKQFVAVHAARRCNSRQGSLVGPQCFGVGFHVLGRVEPFPSARTEHIAGEQDVDTSGRHGAVILQGVPWKPQVEDFDHTVFDEELLHGPIIVAVFDQDRAARRIADALRFHPVRERRDAKRHGEVFLDLAFELRVIGRRARGRELLKLHAVRQLLEASRLHVHFEHVVRVVFPVGQFAQTFDLGQFAREETHQGGTQATTHGLGFTIAVQHLDRVNRSRRRRFATGLAGPVLFIDVDDLFRRHAAIATAAVVSIPDQIARMRCQQVIRHGATELVHLHTHADAVAGGRVKAIQCFVKLVALNRVDRHTVAVFRRINDFPDDFPVAAPCRHGLFQQVHHGHLAAHRRSLAPHGPSGFDALVQRHVQLAVQHLHARLQPEALGPDDVDLHQLDVTLH